MTIDVIEEAHRLVTYSGTIVEALEATRCWLTNGAKAIEQAIKNRSTWIAQPGFTCKQDFRCESAQCPCLIRSAAYEFFALSECMNDVEDIDYLEVQSLTSTTSQRIRKELPTEAVRAMKILGVEDAHLAGLKIYHEVFEASMCCFGDNDFLAWMEGWNESGLRVDSISYGFAPKRLVPFDDATCCYEQLGQAVSIEREAAMEELKQSDKVQFEAMLAKYPYLQSIAPKRLQKPKAETMKVIKAMRAGLDDRAICELLGKSPENVRKIRNRYGHRQDF